MQMARDVPRHNWVVLALLTTLFALAGIDRSLVSILAEPIKHAFSLSDKQLGLVTGLAFAIPYVIAGVPVGLMIDRVNRMRTSWLMVTLWSLATIATSLVSTYPLLLATRAWLGAAESGVAPTFSSLVSDLFPKARRSTAMALLYVSSPIGLTLGFSLGGLIAAHLGWRSAFVISGAVGIVVALLLLAMREPERGAYDDPAERPAPEGPPPLRALWPVFRGRPALFWLIGAGSSVIAAQAGIGAFMAPFMMRVHGMAIAQAGLLIALAYGIGGIIGMPVGGYLADWVKARLPGREMSVAVIASILAAVTASLAFGVQDLRVAIVALWLYSIFCVAGYGITFASFTNELPATFRGVGIAILLIFQNLVGYGVGPGVAGWLSDSFKAAGSPQPLVPSLIILSTGFLLAAFCYWRAGRLIAAREALIEAHAAAA
jgi:predicted MFS family arabinose efflux permease